MSVLWQVCPPAAKLSACHMLKGGDDPLRDLLALLFSRVVSLIISPTCSCTAVNGAGESAYALTTVNPATSIMGEPSG